MIKILFGVIFCTAISVYGQQLTTHDLIISELMIDPNPTVGLADHEYVEIYNPSSYAIDLADLDLSDRVRKVSLPSYSLNPGAYVVLVPNSATGNAAYPKLILSSWPTLNNSDDLIQLHYGNKVIHSVDYSDDWYGDPLKESGGWALEIIDWNYPCSGKLNWSASTNDSGGTPGSINSVSGNQPDRQPPKLLHTFLIDAQEVVFEFDQALYPETTSEINWQSEPPLTLDSLWIPQPHLPKIHFRFLDALQSQVIYKFSISEVRDCNGNQTIQEISGLLALPQAADSLDIVINEIMFDPAPLSSQYLEIYNRSHKAINLKNWSWSEVEAGQLQTPHLIAEDDLIVYPGSISVHTDERSALLTSFPETPWDAIWLLSNFPSLDRREGSIALLNQSRNIIDQVNFSNDMHHSLLANQQGVALLRVSAEGSSLDSKNWVSAPSSIGFGSPGLKNIDYLDSTYSQGLSVRPPVFDPMQPPGYTGIYYEFTAPGNTINILIYDYHGYLVRTLVAHDLAGVQGVVFWDGTDQEGRKLPEGIYIVYLRQRNLQGSFNSWKSKVVISQTR